MAKKPTISVVGAGRVGSALALALREAGYTITSAWSHSRASRQRVHGLLDVPVLDAADVAASGNIVLLSVPDDVITEMAREIAPALHEGQLVVHTSGGTSVDALAPAKDAGARVGSIHPMQTIPDPVRGKDALRGAAVAVTCEPADRLTLMRLARAWGGRPFELADEDKALYHAAAVFASNYVVSSVWAASALLRTAGIRNAERLLGPLVEASVHNVLARGGAKAITGPVARGDAGVVKRHVAALKDVDPTGHAITDAYRALARMTAALIGTDETRIQKATA